MPALRNHKDMRSVGFVVLCLISLITSWSVVRLGKFPVAGILVWTLLNGLLCFVTSIINHNHCHRPIFLSRIANRLFEFILNVCRGYTTASVVMTHNWNHHRFAGSDDDWARTSLAGSQRVDTGLLGGASRLMNYLWRAMTEMRREGRIYRRTQVTGAFRKRFWREQIMLLIVMGAGFALNPFAMTVLVALPWVMAALGLLSINFFQHEACDPGSEWTHSRNFTGRFENWIFFNNGYHTAHHLLPNLHWSELEKAHLNIPAGAIPPEFNAQSLAHYLAKNYLAKR